MTQRNLVSRCFIVSSCHIVTGLVLGLLILALAFLPLQGILLVAGAALAVGLALVDPIFGVYWALLSVPAQEIAHLPGGLSYTQAAMLLDQTKVDPGFTLDLFLGKSWMIKRQYRVALNATISNLLNNTDLRVGGFEQARYDRTDPNRFPPKYSYLFGRNYFAMVTFSF